MVAVAVVAAVALPPEGAAAAALGTAVAEWVLAVCAAWRCQMRILGAAVLQGASLMLWSPAPVAPEPVSTNNVLNGSPPNCP